MLIIFRLVPNIFRLNEEFCSIFVFTLVLAIVRFLLINRFSLIRTTFLFYLIYFNKIFYLQTSILQRFFLLFWRIILKRFRFIIISIRNWNFLEAVFFLLNFRILVIIDKFFLKVFLIFLRLGRRFIWLKQVFLFNWFVVVILVLIWNTGLALLLGPWLFWFIYGKVILIVLISGWGFNWLNLILL